MMQATTTTSFTTTPQNSDEAGHLETALATVTDIIREREEKLQRNQKELEEERAAFAAEKIAFGVPGSDDDSAPNDVLRLNVGGQQFDVLRRTLCSVKGSMLAGKFSGRWDGSIERDADGLFYIDQPPDLFEPLVDFLRRKQTETPDTAPVDPPQPSSPCFKNNRVRWRDFLRMLDYYGLTHGVYTTKIDRFFGDAANVVDLGDDAVYRPGVKMAVTSSLCMFKLVAAPLQRQFKSFEVLVTPNEVTELHVGWTAPGHPTAERSSAEDPPRIGMFDRSVGFDFVRFGKQENGHFTQLDKASFVGLFESTASPVILRCERVGWKLFLNDQELCDSANVKDTPLANPAITGIGKWQILKVTFDE